MAASRSRNELEKAQRQQQILEAAVLEFNTKGFEAASMSAIAKRAGLSRTLVNFYFGDKSKLHIALEHLALEKLAEMMTAAESRKTNGIDKLISMTRAYIKFHKDHPGYFYALSRVDDPGLTPSLKQPSKHAIQLLVDVIEYGIRDGTIQHSYQNATQAALIFWASAHGCILIAHNKSQMLKGHWGTSTSALLKSLEVLVLSAFGTDRY